MDVLDLPVDRPFDIITANAVNQMFELHEYKQAMKSIAGALMPGGYFVGYEFVQNDLAERKIVETSKWHPDGLAIWFRSHAFVTLALREAGFYFADIIPFEIGIDLPKPAPGSIEAQTLVSYTIKTDSGNRLLMRGTLNQPWAHIGARKS
jgi:hypothetical protein